MKKILVGFLSSVIVAFLFCLSSVDAHASEKLSDMKEFVPSEAAELVKIDDDVGTLDWYTVSAEYGTPISRGDFYFANDIPVGAYRNSSSLPENISQTWSHTFGSRWTHVSEVGMDILALNAKIKQSSSYEIIQEYTYSLTVQKTLPPGMGVQVYRAYRKYDVPTYRVVKYSPSMGGHTERTYVGYSIVYVPVSLISLDY